MSASSKFDYSSGSPDRPIYGSGHRGSYDATSLDRSGSFREDMETQLLSNQPTMTSGSCVTKGDVLNFFHCLRFDPKSMVVEHKLNRHPEFKRFASAAVGVPMDDSLPTSSKGKQLSSPSLEDLRRLKSGARECGTKARERVRIFSDCLSVVNKCFPSIPSRKRSRLDALANDRSTPLSSIDRSMSRMGASKLGIQNYANTSGLDLQHQKSEEMTKPATPRKRTRTSMIDDKMDGRSSTPARPSGTFNKDRGAIRLSNSISVHGEDRPSSIAVGCWENPKTKKKRTGIKPDVTSSMMTKLVDGYWETKQGIQSRVSTEASPRLNDIRGSRSGLGNGGLGVGKSEGNLQTSSGIRLSIPRADSNNSSPLHERRERLIGQEKEAVDLKVLNKANSREDFSSGSPTSSSKLNTKVRAPRSSSISSVSKLSQTAQRSPSSNDWEVTNCTSKVPGVPGANNCKPKPSVQPSSPTVVSWAQRPQKISRTARRANLQPIVPGNEESPVSDVPPDMVVNGSHFSANSPRQLKMKSDTFSSTTLSESEESGATEDKFRNKNKKGSGNNEKSGQSVQKMSTLLPTRKKKIVTKDNNGDGIRRQGRTGRVVPSSRSVIPVTVEKIGNVETTKRIRTSRLGPDKPERAGRPPTRKVSDRKAHSRQKHTTVNEPTNFLDVSDDGHEELLAATKAVTNMAEALSCPFWKKMEPLFRFICDADINYLKEQVNLCSAIDLSVPALLDADSSTFLSNVSEFEREEIGTENVELSPELAVTGAKMNNEISLYQRLVAALIPEGDEELSDVEKDVISYDLYGSRLHVEKDKESNGLVMSQDAGYDHIQNGLIAGWIGTACSEYQYNNMPINERLLLEIHSIGIYPDFVPDPAQSGDEETSENFCELQEKYRKQALKKKNLHGKLLSSVSEAKELQGKEFEVRALDKLVSMAYDKYMSCCGPNAQGVKSANGKLAQQAALAFVQRTLRRYEEFEATGKSCFDEPEYRNMFLSELSNFVDRIPLTCSTENESAKLHPRKSGCSMVVGTSAPFGTQLSPSSNNQEIYSSEMLISPGMASELNTDKEDSWADRAKRKELLLDDVGGTIGMSRGVPSGVGGSLSCNAKGKRSERDRVGKGREVSSRNGNAKVGRPASSNFKGQRKHKSKPKQTHLSASVNCHLGKMCDQPEGTKPNEILGTDIVNDNDEFNLDMLEEPIDLSSLQLPDMDFIGVPNDVNGQDGDIGSWLNFEDDGLQDQDFMGLGIPTDDLANLDMLI